MMRHTPQRRTQKYFSRECLVLIKYSNGGRSGVEPDFLKHIMLLYSAYNFSNRIFHSLFNSQMSIPHFPATVNSFRKFVRGSAGGSLSL